MVRHHPLTILFAAAACLTCGDSTGPGNLGGTVPLGNGTLTTFLDLDANGHPSAIGATFTAGILTGLPAADSFLTVTLPTSAAGTVFKHAYFDYVPHGHAPAGVYDTAHFDFHFYFITDAQRAAIAGGLDTVPVAANKIPTNYKKTGEVFGGMGVHWADSTNAEFTGGTAAFTKSFVYGYHEGAFEFYDIMISKDYLATHPAVSDSIRQPAVFPAAGYYPTQWTLSYDAGTQTFRLALEGFVSR